MISWVKKQDEVKYVLYNNNNPPHTHTDIHIYTYITYIDIYDFMNTENYLERHMLGYKHGLAGG